MFLVTAVIPLAYIAIIILPHRALCETRFLGCADIGAECDSFVMPCILGFVRQISAAPVAAGVKSDTVTVTVIARRALCRAGTRHWRRGADSSGDVANFVESEQILETGSGEVTSMVQLRGSIPLFWSQVLSICLPVLCAQQGFRHTGHGTIVTF